jgi:metallo-beta-lactamase family protein
VLPVFIDSPMAAGSLQIYRERVDELDPDLSTGNAGQQQVSVFATKRMTVVETVEQSKAVMRSPASAIVIAASGMATGGRVLHHLVAGLPDGRNTVMFVGFQGAGTRGRLVVDGSKQIKLLGEIGNVSAKIERLDSMSAHADASETCGGCGLQAAAEDDVHRPRRSRRAGAGKKIQGELKWPTHIAKYLERVELDI